MTEQEQRRLTTYAYTVTWGKVKKEVARLGGTVSGGRCGRWWRFNLDAPDGFVWDATGDTGTIVVEWRDGDAKYRADAVSDALERVTMGVSADED